MVKRTGMSDAHLRPDLRAQNPLYERVAPLKDRFEHERCPLHSRALADQHKSEAVRRREAIERGEKHIVREAARAAFKAKRRASMIERERPVLRPAPPWASRYEFERRRFQARLAIEHAHSIAPHPENPTPTPEERTMNDDYQEQDRERGDAPEIVLKDGALRAAAWREVGEYGPYYNSKVSRLYRDREGQVRETSSLREKDLLPSIELTRELREAIRERKREHAQSQEQAHDGRHTQAWHDEERSSKDIQREAFKEERRSQSKPRKRPRDR